MWDGWGLAGAAAVALVLPAAGCSPDGGAAAGPRPPEIRDSAGVRTVLNHEPQWGPGEAWTLPAEPVLRIGMVEGPEEYLFDRIEGVTRLSDGTIVVLNSGDGSVRYYDADGGHVRSVGREGRGPGDMRAGRWLHRLADDVVQITHTDGALRYGPEGTLVGDYRLGWGRIHELGRAAGVESSSGFLMEACGLPAPVFLGESVLLCSSTYTDVRFLPEEPGIHESIALVARSDTSLAGIDTLGIFTRWSRAAYRAGGEVWSVRFLAPHGPWGRLGLSGSPPQVVFTDARRYRVERHPVDGSGPVLAVERAGGLRAATDAELDRFERAFEADRYRPAGDPDDFRDRLAVADSLSIVSGQPFVDDLLALWVPLEVPWDADPRPNDVFAADGTWLGVVMLPRGFAAREIGVDYVLGVEQDELGVEYVVMYHLHGRNADGAAGG